MPRASNIRITAAKGAIRAHNMLTGGMALDHTSQDSIRENLKHLLISLITYCEEACVDFDVAIQAIRGPIDQGKSHAEHT